MTSKIGCHRGKKRNDTFAKLLGQVREANRKFDKVRDITYILRKI